MRVSAVRVSGNTIFELLIYQNRFKKRWQDSSDIKLFEYGMFDITKTR